MPRTSRTLLLAVLGLASACTEVDTSKVAPIDDYASWHKALEVTSEVPGHGDSFRAIYVNDVARTYPHGGRYPQGTVFVKEVWNKDADGMPSSLNYLAIMRKVDGATGDPPPEVGAPIHEGWLISRADGLGQKETYLELCWKSCHVQGPVDHAWFDYGE